MTRLAVVSVAVVFCAVLTLRAGPAKTSVAFVAAPAHGAASVAAPRLSPNDTIKEYCTGCHNQYDLKGELDLENFDVTKAADHAATGEKMIRKLRAGLMPPKSEPQPDRDTRMALVTALETTLDKAAAKPMPGRRTFQRLNRAEYAAAIKSIFGIDVDVAAYLPSDTISASFDNIADVQMPSATVMQGYMRAAAYVASAVVGDPAADPSSTTYEVPRTESQKERVEGAPFGTRGGIVVTHNFLADGDYKFQLLLHGEPTGLLFGRTIGNKIQMEVAIDDQRAQLIKVDRWITESDGPGLVLTAGPLPVKAGPHKIAATFVREFEGEEDDLIKPIDHTLADTQIGVGYGVTTLPHLRNLAILGPYKVTGVSDNAARQTVFSCRPAKPEDAEACAKQIMQRLATEAYRRPATAADVAELMPFYSQGAKSGDFDAGIRTAVQAMMSSLHFIFRVEEMPAGVRSGTVYRISDADLASRLSFFLWGTIPDQDLVDAARRGDLQKPDLMEKQVRRMLADPRSDALGTRFASQWLRLQDLQKIEPDALLFPYYDETLAESMDKETLLFFDYLVRADRPALELLTADYTFVNERLARHYGIPGITGPDFVKVTYPDDHRRGILGHGSILTLTSHGNRTSPVLRGKWVLEVLLGTPPPPPPPNVPELEKAGDAANGRLLSVAEQLAMHRKSPFCSSCHNVIDPIGLSLDHFDVTGAWRIKDRGVPVVTDGELYDGTKLAGAAELRAALLTRSDVIVTHMTEMLMAYGLGRRVEYYDMPTIRKIVRDASAQNYKMTSLILGVVQSPAFKTAVAEDTNEKTKTVK
jgi:hypothetical protein